MKTLTIEHICGYLPHELKAMRGMEIVSILSIDAEVDWVNLGTAKIAKISNIKPILVPLDKLTDAQYAEVGRMVQNDSEYAKNWLSLGGYLGALNFEEAVQVITYLHSLRCDIYGLIPAGLAISAYDLPENPYKES
jgi:hypothetical protein